MALQTPKRFHPYHDYYTILGVDPSTSTTEIQVAYQNLLDKTQAQPVQVDLEEEPAVAEPASLELLQRAHEVLTSWDLRKAYDSIYKGTPAQRAERAKVKEEMKKLVPQRAKREQAMMEMLASIGY